MHERGLEPQVWITKTLNSKPLHSIKRGNEVGPTVWIDKVVARMNACGYQVSLLRNSHGIRHGKHDGIAIGYYRDSHIWSRVVSLRHRNSIRKSRAFEKSGDTA